jgi:hypothetical protein
MIGKIIGAIAGSKMAKRTSGVSEPFGAVAGLVTATALRRMSIPAMIALAAGGYFAKKTFDKKHESTGTPAGSGKRKSKTPAAKA